MITHIVLVKLKDRGLQNIEYFQDLLTALNGKIPTLLSLRVERDIVHSERAYDFVIVATFNDLEGLKAYQSHPAHTPVVDELKRRAESMAVVDHE